ncbi:lysophospholipid acyltransferase family protein [Puniceicoccus vermicola]|uniref:Lysophospholipid acyltransferase family protein n=1 Tax=Puniceicoccus vermicola TaxID=388746 RepID=A0A7X1AX68_9BACT|nr:GNAT family N-acyltransferase [Puniceicoccus vermicola]MBC2600658.1 lysophospholipid acyltransferase family protein [Puniceicoccus vermicola]
MKPCTDDESLIELEKSIQNPLARKGYGLVSPMLERLIGIRAVNQLYDSSRRSSPETFFQNTLRSLGVSYRFSEQEAARIPPDGPVFVISNHPFGGLDGIILGDFLQSIRKDSKLLANYLLLRMSEMEPLVYGIDPFGGTKAARYNARSVKESLRWVRDGHLLATFPAGEVSHFRLKQKRVTDSDWNPVSAKLIQKSGACVVPIFFYGGNSFFFNLMGTIHPRLRTLLLARELTNKRGREVSLKIGSPISAGKIAKFTDEKDLLDFLRLRTYLLGGSERRPRGPLRIRPNIRLAIPQKQKPVDPDHDPLIEPVPKKKLVGEIERLAEGSLIFERKQFRVYVVKGSDAPNILLEIGRLRELTFRDVSEGTGKPYDTDHFDLDYLQLFLWNAEEQEIVGGYRMGQTDAILPKKRKRGFYTSTLFRFRTAFLESMDPAMELGRSFIIPSYQRKFATLSLLWQGIGAFISANPRYRYLFGPVSINCEYETISKDLIIHFLRGNNFDPLLSGKVKAKTPPEKSRLLSKEEKAAIARGVKDIDDVSALIAEIEPDQKGVPTLLRHYVKLNARFLSFNVDADFSDVLDGLMVVDLLETDEKTLRFFMGGEEQTKRFYRQHRKEVELAEQI